MEDNKGIPAVSGQFTLNEWNERELEIAEKAEEFQSQQEELNAAIEDLISKNEHLSKTLGELSKRNGELDQIIYRMSHDLRTPVTSILGVCNLMKMEGLPSSFDAHLEHIQKKGFEMDNLLKSLSSFSQVAFEELKIEDTKVDEVVNEVLDSLRLEKGFNEIHFSFLQEGEEIILTDRNKLFLLMRSIVKNAIDFRSIDRRCLISLRIHVGEQQLTFQCLDNGIGIEENVKSNILNMFYRGSERSTGSGLGLYIANETLARLKGNIEVTSIQRETSFKFTIPYSANRQSSDDNYPYVS